MELHHLGDKVDTYGLCIVYRSWLQTLLLPTHIHGEFDSAIIH